MIASLLITAGLLELALRSFGPVLPGSYRTGPLIEPDPVLGWRNIPGSVTWYRTPEYTVRVEVNAQGRIGPVIADRNPAGPPRVLLLGDSFMQAAQVPYEDGFTRRLERELAPRARFELVNAGVASYGTDQEVLLLEQQYDEVRPDAVVLLFTVSNDVWNNDWRLESTRQAKPKPYFEPAGESGLTLRRLGPNDLSILDHLRATLARSALLTTLKSGVFDRVTDARALAEAQRRQLDVLDEPAGEWVRAWEITDLIFERLARFARARALPVVVVIAPDGCQVHMELCGGSTARHASAVPQRQLAGSLARLGVPVIDLLPGFRERAQRDGTSLYFHQDLHWNARGNALAAEIVARTLPELLKDIPAR